MTLRMSIAHRDAIRRLADASAIEICGLLLGTAGCVTQIVPCANVAADPATRFEIDPASLIAAHRAARSGKDDVIGHFHSHPGGIAAPSPRDAADAAADGAYWVIAGGEAMTAWRAVREGARHGRFDPVTLIVAPGCAPADAP